MSTDEEAHFTDQVRRDREARESASVPAEVHLSSPDGFPDEPTGLGAVVEVVDSCDPRESRLWIRTGRPDRPWTWASIVRRSWANLVGSSDSIKILNRGWTDEPDPNAREWDSLDQVPADVYRVKSRRTGLILSRSAWAWKGQWFEVSSSGLPASATKPGQAFSALGPFDPA